jgi:hypothetical protein
MSWRRTLTLESGSRHTCQVTATRPTMSSMLPNVSDVSFTTPFTCIILTCSHRLQRKVPSLWGLWNRLVLWIIKPMRWHSETSICKETSLLLPRNFCHREWFQHTLISHIPTYAHNYFAAGYTCCCSYTRQRSVSIVPYSLLLPLMLPPIVQEGILRRHLQVNAT